MKHIRILTLLLALVLLCTGCAAGGAADEDGFADLEQIGQMGPEMHDAAGIALAVDVAQHEIGRAHV